MNRALPFAALLTAAAMAASPALAQAWPATTAAATPRLGTERQAVAPDGQFAGLRRAGDSAALRTARHTGGQRPLVLQTRASLEEVEAPEIDIRAKDAWYEDEGFRMSPTRLAFKRRF